MISLTLKHWQLRCADCFHALAIRRDTRAQRKASCNAHPYCLQAGLQGNTRAACRPMLC